MASLKNLLLGGRSPNDLRLALDDRLVATYNAMKRTGERKVSTETRALLNRNRALHGRHAGKRCFIIGNGPSIRQQDLTKLADEFTFVVNRFIHHPDAEAINPTYYVIVDPKFGTGAWGTDFVEQAEQRLPNVEIFLAPGGYALTETQGIMLKQKRHVVLPNQLFHFGYARSPDLTRGLPGMDNVTKIALSTAVAMGFTEINLLGIDANGLLLSEGSHFYGHEERTTDQIELEKSLTSMAMGLRSWRAIIPWAAERGVRVQSMNPWSALTALPQAEFPWPLEAAP